MNGPGKIHIKMPLVVAPPTPPEPPRDADEPDAPASAAAVPLVIAQRPPPADTHNVLEHLYDAIVLADLLGIIRQCNRRTEALFGYPLASLPGMSLALLVDGINASLLQLMDQQLMNGRFTVLEARCTRQDGSQFPAEIAVGAIALEDGPGLCFSIRNINQRREMQHHVRMALNALEHAVCALVMVDLDARVTFVNPAFCSLWGVARPDAVLGRSLDELFGAAAASLLRACLASQAPWTGTLNLARADGTPLRVQASAAPNLDNANELAGLVLSFLEIAPRAPASAS